MKTATMANPSLRLSFTIWRRVHLPNLRQSIWTVVWLALPLATATVMVLLNEGIVHQILRFGWIVALLFMTLVFSTLGFATAKKMMELGYAPRSMRWRVPVLTLASFVAPALALALNEPAWAGALVAATSSLRYLHPTPAALIAALLLAAASGFLAGRLDLVVGSLVALIPLEILLGSDPWRMISAKQAMPPPSCSIGGG